MNMRKITSMTLVLSLIVLIVNSLVLYVVPEGRVAYWADWTFLGLTKSDWGEQHTTVGFLFAAAGILHIYYNWNPIVAYMKNKAKELKVFTGAFNIALILTVVFVVGTYFHTPPMSTIINISEHFKDAASEKYGEPPYGHAESSSLKMFTKRENLDLALSMELLRNAGIEVTGEKQIIKEIAKNNGKSPQDIHLIIKSAGIQLTAPAKGGGEAASAGLPTSPKSGLGKKLLKDICNEYNIDVDMMIKGLQQKGITTSPDVKLKEVGAENDMTPLQVYELMVEISAGE